MHWLFLHFPHLQAQWRTRSVEQEKVLVILDPQNRVEECNQTALKAGIEQGMNLATALALCPELVTYAANSLYRQGALERLAEVAYDLCAQVAIHPQGLILEVDSMLRLFGGWDNYWLQLQKRFLPWQLHWQVARAETPLGAQLLACYRNDVNTSSEQMQKELQQLPIVATDLDEKTIHRLNRMGLSTLGQILSLPDDALRKRLGQALTLWLARLRGEQPELLEWFQPAQRYHQTIDLLYEVAHTQGLNFPLLRMLQDLGDYLRHRQQQVQTVVLLLEHRESKESQVQIDLAEPEMRVNALLKLFQLKLEQFLLCSPVIAMTLKVAQFHQTQMPPTDLFEQRSGLGFSRQQLVSHLQARLSHPVVRGIKLKPEHRPECAWEDCRPAESHSDARSPLPNRRPTWLLPEPQPLPADTIELIAGPERIASGWWDSDKVKRDYFIARLSETSLAWIFRQPDGRWFIHGWFG